MQNRLKEVLIFLILSCLTIILHVILLRPILKMSLNGDDWNSRLLAKTLNLRNPLTIFYEIANGRYGFMNVRYHIGILEHIWGYNVQAFHATNIFLKILAALSIYPAILIIFRNRALALSTTIMFSAGYTVASNLEWVIQGIDYLSILVMNLFFIAYFFFAKDRKIDWRRMFLAIILILFTFFLSPSRMYPLFIIPFLIELFLIIKEPTIESINNSIKRVIFFYLPLIILKVLLPAPNEFHFPTIPILNHIKIGNWQDVLSAIQGIGLILLPKNLSSAKTSTEIISYILAFNKFFSPWLTLLLSIILSKNHVRFFVEILLLNFITDIVVYLIFNNYFSVNPASINLILIGIYIFIISMVTFAEWLISQRKRNELVPIWTGPFFSFVFILSTEALVPNSLSPVHRYLTIPALGIYLMVSGIISCFWVKVAKFKNITVHILCGLIILALFIFYFRTSSMIIYDYYNGATIHFRSYAENEQILNDIKASLTKYNYQINEPALFIFNDSEDPQNGQFNVEGVLNNFTSWVHMPNGNIEKGCKALLVEDSKEAITKYAVNKDGQVGLQYPSTCIYASKNSYQPYIINSNVLTFFPARSIYGFKLKDRQVIDVRDSILNLLSSQ